MEHSKVDLVPPIDINENLSRIKNGSEVSSGTTPRLNTEHVNYTEDEASLLVETPRSLPISEFTETDAEKTGLPLPQSTLIGDKKTSQATLSGKRSLKAHRSNMLVKGKVPAGIPKKAINSTSAIPVKVSRPPSKLSVKPSKTSSLVARHIVKTPRNVVNKHTLEVQYMNKHKRLMQYKKDLLDKQRPVVDLYQNLLEVKRQLADFGKIVELEEVKFVLGSDVFSQNSTCPNKRQETDKSAGDGVSEEMVQNMRMSIETIPETLMSVCQNLVSRRDAIVELLESVSQAEFDKSDLPEKIVSLKDEGIEIKKSLDALIQESKERITELVNNWYTLLEKKHQECGETDKVHELEQQINQKDMLLQESKQVIVDLQKKLEEKRQLHEKSVLEFENAIKHYTENIKKVTIDLENEKKNFAEIKLRNQGNAQTIKTLKTRLTESEKLLKDTETKNAELVKKLKSAQEHLKQKESLWSKEREELMKNIGGQERLLQKLTEDRNNFQTRVEEEKKEQQSNEQELRHQIKSLEEELKQIKVDLDSTKQIKDELTEKYEKLENEFVKIEKDEASKINTISNQINWGKSTASADVQAELYSELLATKVTLREYEEKLRILEKDSQKWYDEKEELNGRISNLMLTPDICKQEEIINKYKELLQESERRLSEKSIEVAKLNAELRHLKVRQDALEEQNLNCPTDELRKMVADGRQKLSEIMKKSMENEQKLAHYESTIEKQHKQMNEMENLLRVRDGLIGMIKAKKDELMMEKDSLTRYCKDVRNMLAETREDLRAKSEIIRELQEKLEKKEKTCTVMEKKIHELEENLAYTNEKRFKLQDTIGSMEKELQSTKAHVNQLTELHQQSRYELGMPKFSKRNISDSVNNSKGESAITLLNSTTLDKLTFHQHCSTDLNLELPIREMEMIRKRLYKLSQLQLPVPLDNEPLINDDVKLVHSTASLYTFGNNNAYKKMIELEKKRYEVLQKQTDESYENLSYLLRLSMPSEPPIHDRIKKYFNDDAVGTFAAIKERKQNLEGLDLISHPDAMCRLRPNSDLKSLLSRSASDQRKPGIKHNISDFNIPTLTHEKFDEFNVSGIENLRRQGSGKTFDLTSLIATAGGSTNFANDFTDSDILSLKTRPFPRSASLRKDKTLHLNPKLHYNKIYLSRLSDTYRDLNDSLTVIRKTLNDGSKAPADGTVNESRKKKF